ncbi:MAG: HAMP domain-containing histidine kinase [Kiritimatiellae bacterium]|nr:HAMP domain-containing histidine kinase [Kiritimatiellia bacterium]
MRFSKDPLARAIFRRVVFLGALIMLVWMPYHIRDTNEKLATAADSAYRMKDIADSKDALMRVVIEARESTWIPTALSVVTIVLLLLAAASISKPVGTLQSFLREIIHDLRGPVSSFKHNVEYALAGYKEPKTALEEMQESSETLLEMFDVQSEIIRNYNGEVREPLEDVDLADVVGGLADMFESAAEAKGVKLGCSVPNEPVVVRSHRQKLLRLVSNLVDNAVKYTDKGSISVSLERKFPGRVKLTVADTGIGMSKECQSHMFERFYRAERSSSRPGDGNGLSYVDSVVKLYGGTIGCKSALGKGTTITVVLPLDMTP